ncbi:Glucose-methanol-choline oxidoreductase [Penicillium canescens]|nr:Glucose-methanol-choline oxidoreductase [Penicillium canescens]
MRSFIGFIATLLVFVDFGLSNTLSYEFNVRDAGNATFDYVIVGSGTAGLTIAARLADQKFQVAVVEAGGYYELMHPDARVPGSCSLGAGADVCTTTPIEWGFVAHRVCIKLHDLSRFFGVTGLRVVDASAFVILPPGHPQSTGFMLAEKIAADIIINGSA